MFDSNMSAEWVAAQWAKFPCKLMPNGDVRTGPVRLSFPNILTPGKPTASRPDGQWGTVILFPADADLSVLFAERGRVATENWPTAGTPGGPKLYNPIRDQDVDGKGNGGEADRYKGYVKGSMRIGANCTGPIPVWDTRLAPIVDPKRVYPGVWALCGLRCFPFTKDGQKGPTFGLQNVMIVADDTDIGGGAPATAAEAFGDVQIDAGDIDPSAAFAGTQPSATKAVVDPFA
jgi:hypothetical protein